MKANMEENQNKQINQNKYICNICNCPDKYFLCSFCFNKYNDNYKHKKKNFEESEKSMAGKIEYLLKCNQAKSKTLNKKIHLDKYKQILLERIKQEEDLIKNYEEEFQKYEKLIIEQKDKNNRINHKLEEVNTKESNLFDSAANLGESDNIINENKNEDIDEIKDEINKINEKIINYKIKYIYDLFEESFIKNKTIIKITDFFNIISEEPENKEENNQNFSVLELQDTLSKEIKIEVFKENSENSDIYLKRFNSFFVSMVSFLEKAYKRFKLQMPYQINFPKIKNKEVEYKISLKKNELNENNIINNAVDGYHLLNINYEYLINFIFGDSVRLKYMFDLSFFTKNKNENLGSLKNIEEESKINEKSEEFQGFVVLDF
jgi:hypothetical protein